MPNIPPPLKVYFLVTKLLNSSFLTLLVVVFCNWHSSAQLGEKCLDHFSPAVSKAEKEDSTLFTSLPYIGLGQAYISKDKSATVTTSLNLNPVSQKVPSVTLSKSCVGLQELHVYHKVLKCVSPRTAPMRETHWRGKADADYSHIQVWRKANIAL